MTNRQLPQQQLSQQQLPHLKEAESIEELELMDDEDEYEGVMTNNLITNNLMTNNLMTNNLMTNNLIE